MKQHKILWDNDIEFYRENGYLVCNALFTDNEVDELASSMTRIIETHGNETIGWPGSWRSAYLDESETHETKAVFMHNPQFYSDAWGRVLYHEKLLSVVADLVGEPVQYHHTVLHAKPPQKGTPFPMHQDFPFYPHNGKEFVACILHLDNTPIESGPLQVIPGSHKLGPLPHVKQEGSAPYLPLDEYHPDRTETVPLPVAAGSVIFFDYCLVHWSTMNRTDNWRKSVRFGFHNAALTPLHFNRNEPYNNLIVSGFKK